MTDETKRAEHDATIESTRVQLEALQERTIEQMRRELVGET